MLPTQALLTPPQEVGRAALEFVHDFDTDAYRCGIVAAATCVVESGARVSMPGLTKADPAAPAVGAAAPGGGGACRPCPAYGASPQLEAEAGMVLLWALAVGGRLRGGYAVSLGAEELVRKGQARSRLHAWGAL